MDLDSIRAHLGLVAPLEGLADEWPRASAAFDAEGSRFLSSEFVGETCTALAMAPALRDAIEAALPDFHANAPLFRLAWHAYYHLFLSGDPARWRHFESWPRLPLELGPPGRMFFAFVLLAGTPHVLVLHRERGIQPAVTFATLRDIEVWMREYRTQHGQWGLDHMGWFKNHFTGRLYALGRLQFMLDRFTVDFHAFRHRATRAVVLLAGEGMVFRKDGQFSGINGVDDPAPWSAHYHVEADSVTGHPVDPRHGAVTSSTVRLPLEEWDVVVEKDDLALSVHIPASGPLEPEACLESYRKAAAFFLRHFSDYAYRALTCASWLLDVQLERYLPPTSNIVRFLRDFYLFPVPGTSDSQTIERVFGFNVTTLDLSAAPQDTPVRRAVVGHMRNGGRWRQGGGVIFAEDLDRMPQAYRRH